MSEREKCNTVRFPYARRRIIVPDGYAVVRYPAVREPYGVNTALVPVSVIGLMPDKNSMHE